mgnify:CR=1 FL=1
MAINCVCIKCNVSFVSNDQADFDGEAFCESCKEKNKEIAKRVDEMITAKRASKETVNIGNVYQELRKEKNRKKIPYLNLK